MKSVTSIESAVTSTTRGWLIVDAQGREVASPGSGCVQWLPGNEGVLSVSDGRSRLMRASHDWQHEPVDVPPGLCDSGRVAAVEDR